MSNRLLERYQNGEYREVWSDLVALGAEVRSERYFKDAVEVAVETMKRARQNVESLIVKLDRLGYEFTTDPPNQPSNVMFGGQEMDFASLLQMAGPTLEKYTAPGFLPSDSHDSAMSRMANALASLQKSGAALAMPHKSKAKNPLQDPEVIAPPNKKTVEDLDRFEKMLRGPLPLSLRQWYEQVGSVNLMGVHEVLNPPCSGPCPDPLVIYPFLEVAESDYGDELCDWENDVLDLTIAPDGLHKAFVSGGNAYIIDVPDPAADAEFQWDGPPGKFVEYLRYTFEWGGFPGWVAEKGRPEKELKFLTEGLLPI